MQNSSGSVNDTIADQASLHKRSFPLCPKCNQTCSKEDPSVIKAFNQVYHNNCFVCEDCQKPVVDKYFIVDDHAPLQPQQKYQKRKKIVLCEFHHLSRLGLICLKCNQPITVTAEYNYHSECVQCPFCATATSNQYEFKGKSYCRLHFSLIPDTHCAGCKQAILDQYVEHHSLPNQIWHPECYMIFRFWGVKLAPAPSLIKSDISNLITTQERIRTTVARVWGDLSSFEESSANCISDMLLNVAAGSFIEGMRMANQFVLHLEILLSALNALNRHLTLQNQDIQCSEESKLICKQIIQFFQLLSTPAEADSSTTQELLLLVTNLAQNLKLLIRSGLSTALRLEREYGIKDATNEFLEQLSELQKRRVCIAGRYWFKDTSGPGIALDGLPAFTCSTCQQSIANADYYMCQQKKWHKICLVCHTCSQPLDENSALVTTSAPYCSSCFTDSGIKDVMHCKLVTPLEHSLHELKLYLAGMSFYSASSDLTIKNSPSLDINSSKEPNEKTQFENKDNPIKIKRHYSLLRKLKNSVQDQQSKRATTPERRSSVKIGRMGRKSTQAASNPAQARDTITKEGKRKSMTIDTVVPRYNGESSSISPTVLEQHTPTIVASPISPLTPLSIKAQKENTLTSVRRSISADSQRKRRSSLISIFDRRKRKESRRASIWTVNEADTALLENMYFPYLTPTQDLIVRHASIIALQPLITPPVSLDELAAYINPKSTQKSINGQKKTANTALFQKWERFLARNIKLASLSIPPLVAKGEKSVCAHGTFGVPLSIIALRDHERELKIKNTAAENEKKGVTLHDISPAFNASLSSDAFIPSFVKSCVALLLKTDIATEGIFRKNGNIRQLRSLCTSIDELGSDLDQATIQSILANENAVQLAALLKRYLRDLPEPLLTFSLYELFVRCGRIASKQRKRALHLVCCLLPKPNRDTMLLIFCCLKWVATYSDINKMSISNLARVFAPTILFDRAANLSNTSADVRQGAQEEINVIETLIAEVDDISLIPSELASVAMDNMHRLSSKEFISQYQQLLVPAANSKKPSKSSNLNDIVKKSKALDSCVKTSDNCISEKIDLVSLKKANEKGTHGTKQRRKSWLYALTKR